MTLCIAALCKHHGEPRIVVCTDFQVSTKTASSETQSKISLFQAAPFGAVYSGDMAATRELVSVYEVATIDTHCTIDRLKAQLLEPVHLMKDSMIESSVRRLVGLSYREFLDRSTQFDSGLRSRVFSDIDETNIGVHLLLFGYRMRQPLLFKEAWENIYHCEHFACIGDGNEAAEQVLHRREQGRSESLISTLYNVYEAKRLGEVAPSVGQLTGIYIFGPPTDGDATLLANAQIVSVDGLKYLEKCFAKYGPRPVKGLQMPDEEAFFWSPERIAQLRHRIDDADGAIAKVKAT